VSPGSGKGHSGGRLLYLWQYALTPRKTPHPRRVCGQSGGHFHSRFRRRHVYQITPLGQVVCESAVMWVKQLPFPVQDGYFSKEREFPELTAQLVPPLQGCRRWKPRQRKGTIQTMLGSCSVALQINSGVKKHPPYGWASILCPDKVVVAGRGVERWERERKREWEW